MKKLFFTASMLMAMGTVVPAGGSWYDHIRDNWKKYIAGVVATIGLGTVAYLNSDKLSSYSTARHNEESARKVRTGSEGNEKGDSAPLGQLTIPSDPKPTLRLYSPLEKGERDIKPSLWSGIGQGWRSRQSGNLPKLETQGTENPLRTKFSERMKQLGDGWNQFGARLNEYGQRADKGQQEHKAEQRNLEERFQRDILPEIKNSADFIKSHVVGATVIDPVVKTIDYFTGTTPGNWTVQNYVDNKYKKRAQNRERSARKRVELNPSDYQDIDL